MFSTELHIQVRVLGRAFMAPLVFRVTRGFSLGIVISEECLQRNVIEGKMFDKGRH